jgi:hypothetical protein
MSTVQDYLDLITSEHDDKPNFVAMVTLYTSVLVQIQSVLNSFIPLFDLDTPPVGNQLDIIGQWVGVSRDVAIPITGVYFTWDGSVAQGWDNGVWQDPSQPSAITVLPDDSYLILIKAKIAANHWDGTTEGAYAIWNILFPNFIILIQDNQNMSFVVAIQGIVPDSLTVALITGGDLLLRPEGVLISEYIIPVNTGPLFGWDIENAYIKGWNEGSWGSELAPT